MRGKGFGRGLSQFPSMKKTLKSCKMKGKFENVVFIDVDGDIGENVIVLDAPETFEKDLQGSSGSKGEQKFPSPSIISIDDDDETDNEDDPEICFKYGGDVDSEASSSKSCPAPDFMPKPAHLDDDECRVVREKNLKFKLSKCKKTYTGKTPCGKRFGLSPESEDSSSESDCSDCELMEGSVGKLREEWEKAFQKRNNARNGQSGLEDQTTASGSHSNTSSTVEEENGTKQSAETPVSSGLRDLNDQKRNSSAFETSADKYSGGTSVNHEVESPFVAPDKKVIDESFSQSKYGPTVEEQYSCARADLKKDPFLSGVGNEELYSKYGPTVEEQFSCAQADLKKDPSLSGVGNEEFHQAPSNSDTHSSDLRHGKTVSNFGDSSQYAETKIKKSSSKVAPMSTSKEDNERNALHAQGSDATASGEKDVIIDREKLKETDEYKRALEEEWASRKRALQIQAEEAQRLRKRRKAENMRLLDMERRQKQRLEEMRESQKKDEENMNLKEQLRTEVRKELNKLELSCIDMASLLRSLGIPVGGGFCPLSQEVHAAYKRALLRFHPDRASKTDIRQQVEAEEKFKLISRMREKFFATPCY